MYLQHIHDYLHFHKSQLRGTEFANVANQRIVILAHCTSSTSIGEGINSAYYRVHDFGWKQVGQGKDSVFLKLLKKWALKFWVYGVFCHKARLCLFFAAKDGEKPSSAHYYLNTFY